MMLPGVWPAIAALTLYGASAMASVPSVCNLDTVTAMPAPCGIWQTGGPGGAVFRVQPSARPGVYEMRIIDSPDLRLASGTVFGTMTPTGTVGCFDAEMKLNPASPASSKKHNFILRFAPDGNTFTMHHYRKGVSVDVLRLMPYLYRLRMTHHNNRPDGIDGGRRIGGDALKYPVRL